MYRQKPRFFAVIVQQASKWIPELSAFGVRPLGGSAVENSARVGLATPFRLKAELRTHFAPSPAPWYKPAMPFRKSLFALVLAVPIFLYIVYPLGALLAESATLPVQKFRAREMKWDAAHQPFAAGVRRAVVEDKTRKAIWGTLELSGLSVLAAGAWGLGLALLWTRCEFQGRRYFAALGYSPMLMPPLVGTLAFYSLAGDGGLLWRVVPFAKFYFTPFVRVLLVHTYSFGCFTFAYVSAALEDADASREEAARNLGAGRIKTFFAATWPVVRAPLLAAALLTFMASAASFSAPYMLDNSGRYLSVEILNEQSDPGLQRGLSVVLAAMSLGALPLFLIVSKRGANRAGVEQGVKGGLRRGLPQAKPVEARWRLALSLLAAVPLLLPPLMAIVGAFVVQAHNQGALLGAFQKLNADDFGALLRSLIYGAITALICVTLAAAIAVALKKSHLLAAAPVEFGIMLALALPGSAVAVALLSAFNNRSWPAFGAALGGGPAILILAYVVRALPLAVRPARAAYEALGDDLAEAAGGLGARYRRIFFKITLPLILPSLLAGGALCFITAAGEYVASMLLAVPNTQPVSVRIDQIWREDTAKAHALALCLMAACAAVALASKLIGEKRWKSSG